MTERKVTEFQRRVYQATSAIPRGKVTTYKLLARRIHCRSCRAVGQALKHNPFAPRVPCHRVIASNLTIGGFQGKTAGGSIARKLRMLRAEGVVFTAGRLANVGRLHTYSSITGKHREESHGKAVYESDGAYEADGERELAEGR